MGASAGFGRHRPDWLGTSDPCSVAVMPKNETRVRSPASGSATESRAARRACGLARLATRSGHSVVVPRHAVRGRHGAILVMVCLLLGCSSGRAPVDQTALATFQNEICSAVRSLGDNRDDFAVVLGLSSTRDAAFAALGRMKERTQAAVDRFEAAGSWAPGKSVSDTLAANQRELVSILTDLETAARSGDQTKWQAASSRYASWYDASVPILKDATARWIALGVRCT